MAKSKYDQSIQRLTKYLKDKEKNRAKWAKEKWLHTDGRIYSFGRIFLPILFIVSFFVQFVLSAIIYNNIPAVQRLRTGGELQNALAREDFSVPVYLVVAAICLILICVTVVRFAIKKYKNSEIMLVVTTGVMCVFTIVRAFLDASTYPDNSLLTDVQPYSAIAIYVVSAIIFGVMFIYSLFLFCVKSQDNKQLKLSIESTLERILPDEEESKLLSEDDMADIINNFLDSKKK